VAENNHPRVVLIYRRVEGGILQVVAIKTRDLTPGT